jgi:Flp pilus assembly protein TadB
MAERLAGEEESYTDTVTAVVAAAVAIVVLMVLVVVVVMVVEVAAAAVAVCVCVKTIYSYFFWTKRAHSFTDAYQHFREYIPLRGPFYPEDLCSRWRNQMW